MSSTPTYTPAVFHFLYLFPFRKTKGKCYEPSVGASKPTFQLDSSAVQFDNMYAEVRETNGQPEKPPIDFDSTDPSSPNYDYAVVPKKDMFKAATEEAVDQPQSTPIVEHQYATVSKTDKNMPTAIASTEDAVPNPGDGSPHPQPKAHRKPPPPKPSPFSGKPHVTHTQASRIYCVCMFDQPAPVCLKLEKTLVICSSVCVLPGAYKDTCFTWHTCGNF